MDRRTNGTGSLPCAIRGSVARLLRSIISPGQDWSVDALASLAKLSRSAFCDRFSALTGMPPSPYVLQWRMHLASTWLRSRRVTVSGAASELGSKSEAAFSRAFKRLNGIFPSRMRQR
ncbi:helix-turn-helix domain-containing protein [Mesorhizobium sp. ArgA1]